MKAKRIITIWLWAGIWKVALSIVVVAALLFGLSVVLTLDTIRAAALGLFMGVLTGVITTRIWRCWRFEWH